MNDWTETTMRFFICFEDFKNVCADYEKRPKVFCFVYELTTSSVSHRIHRAEKVCFDSS